LSLIRPYRKEQCQWTNQIAEPHANIWCLCCLSLVLTHHHNAYLLSISLCLLMFEGAVLIYTFDLLLGYFVKCHTNWCFVSCHYYDLSTNTRNFFVHSSSPLLPGPCVVGPCCEISNCWEYKMACVPVKYPAISIDNFSLPLTFHQFNMANAGIINVLYLPHRFTTFTPNEFPLHAQQGAVFPFPQPPSFANIPLPAHVASRAMRQAPGSTSSESKTKIATVINDMGSDGPSPLLLVLG
jgi:hypothetical protein